ncbi:MAG: hypothetical protein IJZ55_08945 [Lachnospiraceae bacterium]|nr:hypothetical protein [Lachnospiraceae bacterium]
MQTNDERLRKDDFSKMNAAQPVIRPIAMANGKSEKEEGIIPDFTVFTNPQELVEFNVGDSEQTICTLTPQEQHNLAIQAVRESTNQIIRANAAMIKREHAEETSLGTYKKKFLFKMHCNEAMRAQIEEVKVDVDGKPLVVRTNKLIDLADVEVTNMRSPYITTYICADDTDLFCYCLNCRVKGQEKRVFLSAEKLAPSGYLQRKLGAVGITFQYKPYSHIKQILFNFIVSLVDECTDEIYVPYTVGWFSTPEGEHHFCEGGDLTWERIIKLMK